MFTLYGNQYSGNSDKVRLLLDYLGMPYEWVEVDLLNGEQFSPAFTNINPNAKVPVLELEPGFYLTESNAILTFLAEGTALMPRAPRERARVMQWLFFEQYSHEPHVAGARLIVRFLGTPEDEREALAAKQEAGYRAFKLLDEHLSGQPMMVGESLTIADFSLYAYTCLAHEGGFDLSDFESLKAWMKRVKDALAAPGAMAARAA